MRDYERIPNNIQCLCPTLERLEGGRDVFGSPDFEDGDIETERARSRLNFTHLLHSGRILNIGYYRQPAETRHNLAQ